MATGSPANHPVRRGHYGFDAPYAAIGMAVGGILCMLMAAGWSMSLRPTHGPLWLGLYGLAILAGSASFVYTTRRGKFLVWAELVDALHLRGDERVLDLGCGRGLVLLEVARHLNTGKAVGVDLWHSMDQSGNHEAITRANAEAEGVSDRVQLETGNMSALPFADASFDVIVSALAIHNIRKDADRHRAIDEAVRVLRPGGRLLIADFRNTADYVERLREQHGMTDVSRCNLGWRYWYGGPPWATWLVRANKPGSTGRRACHVHEPDA